MNRFFWILNMALRDSRGSRRKLFLFTASMVLGVAALVAISSFGENLKLAVDEEAKSLLGADLSLERGAPFEPATEAIIDSLGGIQSRQISFPSMAYFPASEGSRLATVRALEPGYPFYGTIDTDPPSAATTYLDGENALLDGTLMEQFGASVGDTVRIGRYGYRIAGELKKTPRESAAMSLVSPRIYIPMARLDSTLLQRGSQADYEVYFKFEDGRNAEEIIETLGPTLRSQRVGFDTVEEIREDWNEGLTNLYRFLNLVGFIALLLGGVGIASAIHVYIKQRIETVAVLRCIGARSTPTFLIYLIQASVMGLAAACIGSAIGLGIQWSLPRLLADFLPVAVEVRLSWGPVLLGLGIGLGVSTLFALLPLMSIRSISPLLTLRKSVEMPTVPRIWSYLIYGILAIAIAGFAVMQAPEWPIGLAYAAGIGAVFGLLTLVALAVTHLARRYFPASWSYPWRQGFSNLYRPNNQTVILMLSLGLGTFLIMTLFLVQQALLDQIQVSGGEDRPNMVFFDIQPDQLDPVVELVNESGMPIIERVPIVTMRLKQVKDRTIESLRQDSSRGSYRWAHRREYRSSYRTALAESETLIEGEFFGQYEEGDGPVPISLELDIADQLNVTLGDTLIWDVQGVPVTTRVSSIRAVDWQRFQTNFFVIFPEGVLEEAPQFFVLLTRSEGSEQAGRVQSAVVKDYPNVSAIDLTLILTVFDAIFSRISFVLRFMALFSILTGVIVLISSVTVSRYQRISESVLLKTLGASRSQVVKILLIEYLFLGVLAAFTGIVLALVSAWLLSLFVFETAFIPSPGALILAVLLVTGLTVAVGMANSRGIYARPPLEVLRAEV